MARPKYTQASSPTLTDFEADMFEAEHERKRVVYNVQKDLYSLALDLGQTDAQAREKIDGLFAAFASEWALYVLTGSPAINAAIANDAALSWLNLDANGQTIRQRLINRLS